MTAEPMTFEPMQRRVLGVLLEKSLSQPEYYPMTLNAVVTACNQKQNRDPVMTLSENEAYRALEALRERSLVSRILPGQGARVDRYRHEVNTCLGWQKREQAVMAELLLRGPQTVGELRTRCSRFCPFDDLEAVSIVLECLTERDPPLVATLPRAAGQSAVRYDHLLYPPAEATAQPAPVSAPAPPQTSAPPPPQPAAEVEAFRNELHDLQAEVADLHQELAEVRRRLEAIESRIS